MKKRTKKLIYPKMLCTCGHYEEDHRFNAIRKRNWCLFDDGDIGNRCSCLDFRLDNLLYLEELNRLNGTGHYNAR